MTGKVIPGAAIWWIDDYVFILDLSSGQEQHVSIGIESLGTVHADWEIANSIIVELLQML